MHFLTTQSYTRSLDSLAQRLSADAYFSFPVVEFRLPFVEFQSALRIDADLQSVVRFGFEDGDPEIAIRCRLAVSRSSVSDLRNDFKGKKSRTKFPA